MIAIVGGGPAGLRAAEVASATGAEVTVYDAKASVGRKFLVAGGGGLNLTRDEPLALFATRYRGPNLPNGLWRKLIEEFTPSDLRAWAANLGIETFVASTKRVYPSEMKAAPLLRRWVQRLRAQGVRFAMHHRWLGWENGQLSFETPTGSVTVQPNATIIALGGGSWPETGSDGGWVSALEKAGVSIAPLAPANCGWEMDSPAGAGEGTPIKNVVVRAGSEEAVGELLITRYGLEGGALYQLGSALRALPAPEITIDFKPSLSPERVLEKLGPAKRNLIAEAVQRLKLGEGAAALLDHHPDRQSWTTAAQMAQIVKACRIRLRQPRPLAEVISSAGGVCWSELNDSLMLRQLPGVFVAGEMIDWEAPTGGYLMQGAFATGQRAARGALFWQK